MSRKLFVFAAILAIAVSLGVALARPASPALAGSGNGSVMVRFESPWGAAFTDEDAGLTTTHNYDPVQDCLGNFPWDMVRIQAHNTPRDPERWLLWFKDGEASTSVWACSKESDCWLETGAPNCAFFLNPQNLLATGTMPLKYTDNNFFGVESQYANAYGMVAQGTVFKPNGEAAHLNVVWRVTWPLGFGEGEPTWHLKINFK